MTSIAAQLVEELRRDRLTIATAESLTGGLLAAEIVTVPGSSTVFLGGVIAYSTELKHTLLGVDTALLNVHGPVHADVAAQMAFGVRTRLTVGGEAASIGVSTTGVAGPGPQEGHAAGTVIVAVSLDSEVRTLSLSLEGSRDEVRRNTVTEALSFVRAILAER